MSERAARDVAPGESWAYPDHSSMAEMIAEERQKKATELAEQLTDYLLPRNSARRDGFVVLARAALLQFAEWLESNRPSPEGQ